MKSEHVIDNSGNVKKIIVLAVLVVIGLGFAIGLALVNQTQDISNKATGPSCQSGQASCEWDDIDGVSEYTVTVEKNTDGTWNTVTTTRASRTKVTWIGETNAQYRCTVQPIAENPECPVDPETKQILCSESVPGVTEVVSVSASPVPSTTDTATLTPAVSVTSSITTTSSSGTPKPSISTTVTTTKTPTSGTPAITDIVVVVATNTPKPGTSSNSSSNGVTTSTPTVSQSPTSKPGTTSASSSTTAPTSSAKTTAKPTLPTTGAIESSLLILAIGLGVIMFGLMVKI